MRHYLCSRTWGKTLCQRQQRNIETQKWYDEENVESLRAAAAKVRFA
jgi:hypothetical protein